MESQQTPQADDDPADVTEVMRRRHAAVETSPATIAAVVRRATGQDVERIERIVRGYDSEVYRVALPRDDVVVRIRRYGSVSYASEAWAIESCRAAGVPVPDVLLVDTVQANDGEHEVMIQRAVPGRPLNELRGTLSRAALAHVWAQAGEALARIHSVRAGGFYKMRQPGVWDFRDGDSIAGSAREDRRSDLAELRSHGYGETDVDALVELIDAGVREFPSAAPVLLHGDFLPDHLFVDEGLRLRGVIDFGDFQGGARIGDIANLRMNEPEVDLRWLRDGYGDQEPFDEYFERRLLLAGAGLQVGYLAHFLRQGNAEEAAVVDRALRETLARWRAEPT